MLQTKTSDEIRQLNDKIAYTGRFIDVLRTEVSKVIVGQSYMMDRLLIGLLSNGHVLLEGVPGLAKTLTIKSLADGIHAKFSRIQFTPDLLPADVIGTLIYNQQKNEFVVRKGPIFANFILADEINRSPAKVQSALLEAMQERQVTIGDSTYKLDEPFLVLATQNPEPTRSGRHLRIARSAGGQVHYESDRRLSNTRGRADHYPAECAGTHSPKSSTCGICAGDTHRT
jgi:MoxR-like ATPase